MVEVHTEGNLRTAEDHIPAILAFNLDKVDDVTSEFPDKWIWLLEVLSASMASLDSKSAIVRPWEAIREL